MRKCTSVLGILLFFINTSVISNTIIDTKVTIKTLEKTNNSELNEFLDKIGHSESGNDYTKVNTLGYMGKFQFGKSTLETLGYKTLTEKQFINNPSLQDTIMIKNLRYNKRRLKKYYPHYVGKIRWGIKITESGMLAAAHLAGQGNVKRFLMYGENPSDDYGTSLSKYISKFSGYDLNLK